MARPLPPLALLCWLAAAPAGADARDQNAVRLREAAETSGLRGQADLERRIAALSDRQIENLVREHQNLGYDDNLLTVIFGGLLLLVLVVWLTVAAVD